MSHDFLGTFNKSQLERFLVFARSQLPLVDARVQHLEAEQARQGSVVFRYDQGIPTQFMADPADSYIGKLLAAYEVLGGNPFHDLRVRLRTDPVFAIRGSETVPVQFMSNGEVQGAPGLADAPTAEIMRQARGWLESVLNGRFDRLERKIRRAIDYADQLEAEITYLKLVTQAVSVEGSFEQLADQLMQLIADTNYRAIFDDAGKDPFGLTVYAPFSSYDATPSNDPNLVDRTAGTAQRQNKGYVGPGEKSA